LTIGCPGLDEVGVVGIDRDHGARDLRRQLDDVALHVGVVRALVVGEDEPPVDAVGKAAEENGERDDAERELALRAGLGRDRGRLGAAIVVHRLLGIGGRGSVGRRAPGRALRIGVGLGHRGLLLFFCEAHRNLRKTVLLARSANTRKLQRGSPALARARTSSPAA
jgi:hypothetical protein